MTHEVTVAQFARFSETTRPPVARWLGWGDSFLDAQPSWNGASHPAVNISWLEARAFCAFVGGRLPTEAEWEYAARGGHPERIYPWDGAFSHDKANGRGGADQWDNAAPVGSFPPNGGLYDMAGNVWEWTSTIYRDYLYDAGDGRENPRSREIRVVRGGSWTDYPKFLRVSIRFVVYSPGFRDGLIGVRCARDVSS
jgi:formylglycine-generating enzyme required for sulfatase activity